MTRSKINARNPGPEHGSWSHRGQSTLGSFIKLRRVDQTVTRGMLSERSGVPEQRLQQIEVNQVTADYGEIKSLAKALKMRERELLEVAGHVRPRSR